MRRVRALLKWLYPGMRVKRWLLLLAAGASIAVVGLAAIALAAGWDPLQQAGRVVVWMAREAGVPVPGSRPILWLGGCVTATGVALGIFATARLWTSLTTAIVPVGDSASLVDAVYRNRYLAQGPRVVVLGGGTGLSTLLRGIKQYTSNIVAVVTVTDDGGSSGRLQQQLGILPPGDIRNCLAALADAEATMVELFQYRFRGAHVGGLCDHAFGNLLIAALCSISDNDFEEAIRQASRVLNIRGRVLPSTLARVSLRAEMEDGSVLEGETSIVHSPLRLRRIWLTPGDAQPLDEVIDAIEKADVIAIGPGSVFTSVLPNLLVRGIPEALQRSRVPKVYICNVMTQPGESDGFSASDHVKAIEAHVQPRVFDYVLLNTGVPSLELLGKYREQGAVLVEPDTDRIRAMGYRPRTGQFVSQSDVVRHDPALLAEAVVRLLL
ncbi:MAG TPA: gluconeogenesis factor YvcK family protein [Chthonomonadales bacterium]|nr:gluconeogenesis factor YvcK family protein [Chthonomonadales bacterium]